MKPPRRVTLLAAGLFLGAGGAALAYGIYLAVAAPMGQLLLAHAWQRQLSGQSSSVRWTPAPIARLSVPELKAEAFVLSQLQTPSLDFAPAHLVGSTQPGEVGNSVIVAHNNSHFRFLRDIKPKQLMRLDLPDGQRLEFRIVEARVVHIANARISLAGQKPALTLITCFPFDGAWRSGPLRFVVTAELAERTRPNPLDPPVMVRR